MASAVMLLPRKDEDILLPERGSLALKLPPGLRSFEDTALTRGKLLAAFGAPTSSRDAYKTTFVYALDVDEGGETRGSVVVADYKGGVSARWYSADDDEGARARAQRALDRALRSAPGDYEATFLWDENIPYGCKWGEPWVLLGWSCWDGSSAPLRLHLEEQEGTPGDPGDDVLRAFFERTAPAGSPPFEMLRDVVLQAWRTQAASGSASDADALSVEARAFRGHFLANVGPLLDDMIAAPGLRGLVSVHPQRWLAPEDAHAALALASSKLTAILDGEAKSGTTRPYPLRRREGLWRAVARELEHLVELTAEARRVSRRVQLRFA